MFVTESFSFRLHNKKKMSGKGKSGKALKRKRRVLKDEIERALTKPAIRRLARRGGVKRLSTHVYQETQDTLKIFLNETIKNSVAFTELARRKTVTARDVIEALKRNPKAMVLYGYPEKK